MLIYRCQAIKSEINKAKEHAENIHKNILKLRVLIRNSTSLFNQLNQILTNSGEFIQLPGISMYYRVINKWSANRTNYYN